MKTTDRPISYRLRPATQDDGDLIYRLRVDGLKEYVTQIWGWDETVQLNRFWTSFDPSRYQVIVVDRHDVGALAIEHRASELFLADIEIAREWRGKGLGSAILRELVSEADRRGVSVSLQVLKTNPALRLYERSGFHITGETNSHYLMSTSGEGPGPT